jgi:hypothetical protein
LAEIGIAQLGAADVGAPQIAAGHEASGQIAAAQIGVRKIGSGEIAAKAARLPAMEFFMGLENLRDPLAAMTNAFGLAQSFAAGNEVQQSHHSTPLFCRC